MALFSACLTFGFSALAPGAVEAQTSSGERLKSPAQNAKKTVTKKAKKTASRKAKSNKSKKIKSKKSNKKVISKSKKKKSSKSKKVTPTISTQQAANTSLFSAAVPAEDTSYNAAALLLDAPSQTNLPVSNPAWEGMDPKEALAAGRVSVLEAGDSIATGRSTAAPGPLPLLGAGAAFAYSRRLRRRIMRVSTKAG